MNDNDTNVIPLPVEKVFPRQVRGVEVYQQSEPPEEMVWEVCPYVRGVLQRCRHCPPSIHDPVYGEVVFGCYGFAAEACRIVFAMQKRLEGDGRKG